MQSTSAPVVLTSATFVIGAKTYTVRRPTVAEYWLGQEYFVVTCEGRAETVGYRSTGAGIVWNQRDGFLQERTGFTSGNVDYILAAMEFFAAERAAKAATVTVITILAPAAAAAPAPAPRPVYDFGANLPYFCDAQPHRRAEYIEAQREMFKAAKEAGLDTKGDDNAQAMRETINALLRINITSRRQLNPLQMRRVTRAFAAGAVRPGWELEDASMLQAA